MVWDTKVDIHQRGLLLWTAAQCDSTFVSLLHLGLCDVSLFFFPGEEQDVFSLLGAAGDGAGIDF